MTPDQFEEEMKRIIAECGFDYESSHAKADALLCRVLVELGYTSGVELFVAMDKWYA